MSYGEQQADAAPDVDVEPVGVDEMVRKERIRSIFDARQEARDHRTKAKKLSSDGRSREASIFYRSALESYVREVEPLFSQTDDGRAYWTDHFFGAIDLRPSWEEVPGDTDKLRLVGDDQILAEPPEGKRVPIQGLKSLFEMGSPIRAQFEVIVASKRIGDQQTTKEASVHRQMPMHVLDEMYAVVNGYLSELGFGIDIQEGEKSTKLDDDLISEVEQWRRENL